MKHLKNEILFTIKDGQETHQIVCFPYLGGYANSFLDLMQQVNVSKEVEVLAINPPGHGTSTQKPIEDIRIMAELYSNEIKDIIKPNCVFFGYSMGGTVAYFVAQHLMKQGMCRGNLSLVISSSDTPNDFKTKSYSSLTDDMLLEHMATYGGFPDELINEKKLLAYFLPAFRADFKVLETAAHLDAEALDIPCYLMLGDDDKIVQVGSAINWTRHFNGNLKISLIKGGTHMMIHNQMQDTAYALKQILSQIDDRYVS